MQRKPWPIVAVALFQWLTAIGDPILSAIASHMSLSTYFRAVWAMNGTWYCLLTFLVLPFISGFAVYQVKKWSFPLFMACTLIASHGALEGALDAFQNFGHNRAQAALVLSITIGAIFVNTLLGAVLLLPSVRRAYFNPDLRWWEALPRFQIEIPATAHFGIDFQNRANCRILNLSEGGVLLEGTFTEAINAGDEAAIRFEFDLPARDAQPARSEDHGTLFAESRVVYVKALEGARKRMGIEFQGMSKASRQDLSALLNAFRKDGVPCIRAETNLASDLAHLNQQLSGFLKAARASKAEAATAAGATVTQLHAKTDEDAKTESDEPTQRKSA